MRFLWLDINASYSHSSLALPALHAQLSEEIKAKTEWEVVSGTIKTTNNEIINKCLKFKPNYIFATGWLFNINKLLEILSRLNSLINLNGIYLGGPQFLGDNESFLISNKYISAVFKGEGEEMFSQFIEKLNSNTDHWQQIQGFEYIKDGKYIKSKIIKVSNFSSLNPPDKSAFFNWNKAFVQIETSRGCFNECKFCVSGIEKDIIQNVSIEQLRTSINLILSKGIKEVRILDRTFNASSTRAIELLNLFEEFAGKIQFHIEVHPAFLSKEFKEVISKLPSGLLHIEVGIQSLREEVIKLSGRKGKCSLALDGLNFLLSLRKFVVHADLIAGLPKYTFLQLVEDSLTLINTRVGEIQLELLKLLPGTIFTKKADCYGIKYSPIPPYEVLQTNDISFAQLEDAMILSKALDYWYNDSSWRSVFVNVFKSSNILLQFIYFLKGKGFYEQVLSYQSKSLLLYEFCNNYSKENIELFNIQWIKNGLSLKMKPAENLKMWSPKSEFAHPFIGVAYKDLATIDSKIYYIVSKESTFWFLFNPHVLRNGPAAQYVDINK